METIRKALDLYVKFRQENNISASNLERQILDADIHRYISISLKSAVVVGVFNNSCVFDCLINGLLECVSNDIDVTAVARAFKCLEKYFCLLVEQPWKPEYRTLKTYGGFYKTKVKAILTNAEAIFNSAGYVIDQDNKMVYRRQEVDDTQLLILSFDCFVASGICEKISEQNNQLKTVGKSLEDAIFDILKNSWPRDVAMEKIAAKRNSSKVIIPPPEIPKREPLSNGVGGKKGYSKQVIYPTEPSPVYDANIDGQSLGNFKYKNNTDPHIPFMDEAEHYPQLSRATPEEHIRESMKLVQQQKKGGLSSEEWKYSPAAVPGVSNPESARTYPPAVADSHRRYQGLPKIDYLKDEGIVSDITSPFKFKSSQSSSTSYTTSYPPSKSVLSDQGYNTGHGFSNLSPIPSSQDMLSETIYRPPDLNGDGNVISQMPLTKSAMQPPRIPSRHLKPINSTARGEDMVDGPAGENGRNKVAIPAEPVYPLMASKLDAELRPPRSLHQLRSGSLKTELKKVVSDNRITKSLDYSFERWQCPACPALNFYSSDNCTSCSFRRLGKEAKKSCTACTFLNSCQSVACEVCGQTLPKVKTYSV